MPNKLSLTRFILLFPIVCLLYVDSRIAKYTAFFLVLVSWATDIFDGRIARKKGMVTEFGAFIDTLIDKLMINVILIVFLDLQLIPAWMVILTFARDLTTQGIRNTLKARGKTLKVTWSGKLRFGFQIFAITIASLLLALSYDFPFLLRLISKIVYTLILVALVIGYYGLIEFFYRNRGIIFKSN